MKFFYIADVKKLFGIKNAYFSRRLAYFKTVFGWLSLA